LRKKRPEKGGRKTPIKRKFSTSPFGGKNQKQKNPGGRKKKFEEKKKKVPPGCQATVQKNENLGGGSHQRGK